MCVCVCVCVSVSVSSVSMNWCVGFFRSKALVKILIG